MVRKSSFRKIAPAEEHHISNLFVVPKKVEVKHTLINFKELNASIPYSHFNVEGVNFLK